eukprot:483762-Prorocentrum_minimum.AAC.1
MEHTADPALPPLSDPFRHVAHALLVGVEALQTSKEFELQQVWCSGVACVALTDVTDVALAGATGVALAGATGVALGCDGCGGVALAGVAGVVLGCGVCGTHGCDGCGARGCNGCGARGCDGCGARVRWVSLFGATSVAL